MKLGFYYTKRKLQLKAFIDKTFSNGVYSVEQIDYLFSEAKKYGLTNYLKAKIEEVIL